MRTNLENQIRKRGGGQHLTNPTEEGMGGAGKWGQELEKGARAGN